MTIACFVAGKLPGQYHRLRLDVGSGQLPVPGGTAAEAHAQSFYVLNIDHGDHDFFSPQQR
jgi:hypothetical protein